MNGNTMTIFKTIAVAASMITSTHVFAEDWTISAITSCETIGGSTSLSSGGLRATGGTAVVRCPLVREAGANTINSVYARMKRASTSGAASFCYVETLSTYGTPSSISSAFAANTTASQSINISLPTQYSYGYASVGCVLVSGDTLYGIRYRQDN